MSTETTQLNKREFILSYQSLIVLYCYFALAIIVGLTVSILVLLHEYTMMHSNSIMQNAIIGCLGATLLGSGIFYSRKLYKLSLDNRIEYKQESKFQKLGIFMYFLLRPIFATAFSFLIILALKVSIVIICVKDETLDFGFIYLTMFLSFFAGFSSGDILAVLESVGKNKMEKFFGNHE